MSDDDKLPKSPTKFMEIDESALDTEWLVQPKLYLTYAEKLADARYLLDEAKTKLDVVKAEVELDVRSNPGNYGLEKTTESVVAAAVVASVAYQNAAKARNDAAYRVSLLHAAVEAIDQRKRTLENLVTLHGQSYFAAPQAKGVGGKEAAADLTKRGVRAKGVRS